MDFYTKTTKDTLVTLKTTPAGLSTREAHKRLKEYGPNTLAIRGEPLWRKIIEPFRSIFMLVLFIAVLVSFWHQAHFDAIIIFAIIMISAIIYYVQRFSTERILRSLQKHKKQSVNVVREGKTIALDSSQLVPGDIIMLEEGDKVPADARIIEARSLRSDESQLTGESLPITKITQPVAANAPIYERRNSLYQGSFIVGGAALAAVFATGNHTEFGRLANLSTEDRSQSPIQNKIDKLITQVIAFVTAASILAFALAVYRGIEVAEALRFVIALAVSAVPESLPIAISVVLVIGMRRMAARKALVRTMSAIESIGAITTIATDKTGTLTRNKLTVRDVWQLEKNTKRLEKTLAYSTLINTGATKVVDPLDTAFAAYKRRDTKAAPQKVLQFEQSVAMSGNQWHHGSQYELFLKGAPEQIIQRSDLTENEREQAIAQLHRLTGLGYRVIALGYTSLKKPLESLEELPAKQRLRFDGLVGVADVLRTEARGAIKTAQGAGITVRMITGDHFETAFQIGQELGLVTHRDQVFDTREMGRMSDAVLIKKIESVRIFSRVIPEHKHRILALLKKNNITAMTGDGVNDVPALTNAHVGIAMGSGTEIAKDAGDIILLDDNFRSIVSAVSEGRTILTNIKRMVTYLLSTNLGEVIVSVAALLVGMPLPLAPVQLLWINLVTDTCMVIPLGLEPGEKRNMNRPPQNSKAPLLSRFMTSRIIIVAITMAAITLSLFIVYSQRYDFDYGRTVAFCALVAMQWASALAMRSDYEPVHRRIWRKNWPFVFGLTLAISLQAAAVFTPLGTLLHVTPIAMSDLIFVNVVPIIGTLTAIELHKWVGRKFFGKSRATATVAR